MVFAAGMGRIGIAWKSPIAVFLIGVLPVNHTAATLLTPSLAFEDTHDVESRNCLRFLGIFYVYLRAALLG